ncbi:MAG: response regulator transcription factor [Coriobacteriales bacterium]|jgi:two-component system alkaline phosphatase synthesis response regulator PhoP|nr:response regulator transcription factor [Coriobacteriales bacterium]
MAQLNLVKQNAVERLSGMIYYVEDDENIRNLAIYALEGKDLTVRGFAAAPEFHAALREQLPDAILLDIMLPGEDGITTLRRLRADNRTAHIPLMMITAKGTEFDIVSGLDAGADDYLSKPFGMMELVSRVNALLRRSLNAIDVDDSVSVNNAQSNTAENQKPSDMPKSGVSDFLNIGIVSLSSSQHTVEVNGKSISLTLKEFDLLRFLMEHTGLVFSRERLLESVWGWNFGGNSRTVDVHVQTLRQKLGDGASIVQTVRGVGYRCKA